MSDSSQASPSQVDEDLTDLRHDSSAAATAHSSTQVLASSPPSSLPSATPSTPSSGNPTPEKKDQKNLIATSADDDLTRTSDKPAKKFKPTESDFRALDYFLLDPKNTESASNALHTFLSGLEQATASPPKKPCTLKQVLQGFLIQQQLLAGIPADQTEPMEGPKSRQSVVSRSGVRKRHATPMLMTVSEKGAFVPRIPPVQFNGDLDPLPPTATMPKPDWVKMAKGNFSRQRSGASVNTNTSDATTSQPSQGVAQPNGNRNNTNSEPTGDIDMSAYFDSPEEQDQITQFFAEHFSTGSGILVDQPAETTNRETDKLEAEDTDSDHDYGMK